MLFEKAPQPYTVVRYDENWFGSSFVVKYEDTIVTSSTMSAETAYTLCKYLNIAYSVGWWDAQAKQND